jgi:hypothetical protein
MLFRSLILVPICASLALAQDSAPIAEPVNPSVVKLSETKYQIGAVTFDHKTREIRFPAKVNMEEGLIEYLIVLAQGKVHEALLITEISPTHLNLAFSLLRFTASRELFVIPDEDGRLTDKYPDVPAAIKAGARIAIDVEWDDQGRTRRVPINDWIQHAVKTTAMDAGPWVYSGSDFNEGKYIPEMTGDIASILVSPAAIVNYPGTDNQDDTAWVAFPKRVPPPETNVTVIIAPYSNTTPLPKP